MNFKKFLPHTIAIVVFAIITIICFKPLFSGKVINQSDITFSDVNFTNNQIVAEVSAQSDGFVMFSQSYFPGWRAYIDGEEVELYCVSGTIMGAKVPEGDHEIKFTYIPTYTILGGIVTVGTYVALILGGIVVRRKRITENKTI